MKNIQLFKPKFRNDEILKEITECLDIGWTGLGFKTQKFEDEWKKYTGLSHAHFLNSNTSGLHLALKILKDANKWNENDEIITTPLTFVSTNHAIMYERLKPIFADIDEYLCLDSSSVEEKITKKTKAVMFVGIGGNFGNFDKIVNICKKYNLKLILDAAHMAGSWLKNKDELKHAGYKSDVSIFSFQVVKNLPTADSGMICFQNDDYDKLARKLSWLGISRDTYQRTSEKGSYKWEYDLVDVGFKYHGNSIMASMALIGLKYLEEDNTRRREICNLYEEGFKNSNILTIKSSDITSVSSRHLYQIRVKKRNDIMEYLNSQGIYPGVHYTDNTVYKMYNDQYKNCPFSNKVSEELISLPLHMYLTNDDIEYIIEKVIQGNKIHN